MAQDANNLIWLDMEMTGLDPNNDSILEIAAPTWREDPTPPLTAIQGYLTLGEDADPDVRLDRAVARREPLVLPHRPLGRAGQ